MTTVINLNILSVFGSNPSELSLNGSESRDQGPGRRQNHSPSRERTIDVTPYSRVLDSSESEIEKHYGSAAGRYRQVQDVATNDGVQKTYDRRGNSIHYFQSKGLHVDSYA